MLNELKEREVQVQESIDILKARKRQEAVLELGRDSSNCEILQGLQLEALQVEYLLLEPDSTWREYVAGNCNMSYRTARRRIRAAEWHSVFGIGIDVLRQIDATRLEQFRDLVNEENVNELVADLLPPEAHGAGLSDADIIAKWKGTEPPQEPSEPKKSVPVRFVDTATKFVNEYETLTEQVRLTYVGDLRRMLR